MRIALTAGLVLAALGLARPAEALRFHRLIDFEIVESSFPLFLEGGTGTAVINVNDATPSATGFVVDFGDIGIAGFIAVELAGAQILSTPGSWQLTHEVACRICTSPGGTMAIEIRSMGPGPIFGHPPLDLDGTSTISFANAVGESLGTTELVLDGVPLSVPEAPTHLLLLAAAGATRLRRPSRRR